MALGQYGPTTCTGAAHGALAELVEAGRDLGDARARPTSRLRVAMHPSPGRSRIVRALPAFIRQYPRLDLHMTLDTDRFRFGERGFDLCILIGDPAATWGHSDTAESLAALRRVDS